MVKNDRAKCEVRMRVRESVLELGRNEICKAEKDASRCSYQMERQEREQPRSRSRSRSSQLQVGWLVGGGTVKCRMEVSNEHDLRLGRELAALDWES